jgi:hypothetical protein
MHILNSVLPFTVKKDFVLGMYVIAAVVSNIKKTWFASLSFNAINECISLKATSID